MSVFFRTHERLDAAKMEVAAFDEETEFPKASQHVVLQNDGFKQFSTGQTISDVISLVIAFQHRQTPSKGGCFTSPTLCQSTLLLVQSPVCCASTAAQPCQKWMVVQLKGLE